MDSRFRGNDGSGWRECGKGGSVSSGEKVFRVCYGTV